MHESAASDSCRAQDDKRRLTLPAAARLSERQSPTAQRDPMPAARLQPPSPPLFCRSHSPLARTSPLPTPSSPKHTPSQARSPWPESECSPIRPRVHLDRKLQYVATSGIFDTYLSIGIGQLTRVARSLEMVEKLGRIHAAKTVMDSHLINSGRGSNRDRSGPIDGCHSNVASLDFELPSRTAFGP